MNTTKRFFRSWVAAVLLVVIAWAMPQQAWAANGDFDNPSVAFSWYSKGPGCLHFKFKMCDGNGRRTFHTGTFGVNLDGKDVDCIYVDESASNTADYIRGLFGNLLADESLLFITNDTRWKPLCWISGKADQHDVTRQESKSYGDGYVEFDWYYPARFAGKKLLFYVHGAKLWNLDNNSYANSNYNKDIGNIEFDDIMLEAYDAILGTEVEDAGMLRIPVTSDHVLNWVEAKYKNGEGLWKQMPRVELEKNAYSAFVRIPAYEPHDSLTITACVTAASVDKSNLPESSWPSEVKGELTKQVGKVAMVHATKSLIAWVDSVGAIHLQWQTDNPGAEDLLESDMFNIQRSLTGKLEDYESIGQEIFAKDSVNYEFVDSTLVSSLMPEQIDSKLGIPLVRYRVIRSSTQELWGTDKNPTASYAQPQFATLSLLQLAEASAEWTDTQERKIQVKWNYKASNASNTYVWDNRAEMRIEVELFNRAGKQVDKITRVLTPAEIKAKQVELSLNRSCVTYDMRMVVESKTSPIGRGTGNLFYTIYSVSDLKYLYQLNSRGENDHNVMLMNDLYISGSDFVNPLGYKPENAYTGNFNGNGHTITHDLTTYLTDYISMFRHLGNNAVVTNLHISGVAYGGNKKGGIVGMVKDGVVCIENCRSNITLQQNVNNTGYSENGGLAGVVAAGASLYINNCLRQGSFYGENHSTGWGGFVGQHEPNAFVKIANSYFNPSGINNITGEDCYTFIHFTDRTSQLSATLINSWYKTALGEPQGLQSDTVPKTIGWKNNLPVMEQMKFSKPLADNTFVITTPADKFYYESSGQVDTQSLEAETLQSSVLLKWAKTEGAIDYFLVHRRTTEEGSQWEVISPQLTDMEYEDKDASPVFDYYYKVSSNNDCEGLHVTYTDSVLGHCVKTGKVEGYVRFSDGTGIPGVRVTASPYGEGADALLARSCTTDEAGFYSIDSLQYWGYQQGAYHLTIAGDGVTKNDLSADCQDGIPVSFNFKTNYEKNCIFTVTTGVKFSGLVMYRGTSIPVHGARFLVDGKEIRSGGGAVESDFEGKFSFRMLARTHTIQAVMDGHSFYQNGYYYENNDTVVNITTDVANTYFYDETRVKLIGRVAGGKKQGDLPLGNSLSTNNLGDNLKMVFTLEGDNASWLVFDNVHRSITERDTVYIHQKASKTDKNEYSTRVHTTRHRMEVLPDTLTGEYEVWLPPVKWKIQQITAEGYATLFQEGKTSDVIDLTDSLTRHTDVIEGSWRSRSGEDIHQVEVTYYAQYNRIYRGSVLLERKQVGFDKYNYFGEKTYTMRPLIGEKQVIPIAYPVTTNDAKTGKTITTTHYTCTRFFK